MSSADPHSAVPGVDAERRLRVAVDVEHAGDRVDRFLGRLLAPHYSRSYLAALVEEGTIGVARGGPARRVKPSYRLEPGDEIVGELGEPASSLPRPEPIAFTVVHSDPQIVVVDKPAGLIVHPGRGQATGTLVNGLLMRFPELAVVGRADRPGIVHRLDRETTGVMVVARTNEAARSLVNQFKQKTVEKEYTAVVWGEMPFDSDWIDLPLGTDPRHPTRRKVLAEGGQPASTFYQVRRRLGRATVVSAFPRTGRTHQIRVHLAHLGFPIIGDAAYGLGTQQVWRRWVARRAEAGQPVPALARHALHARRLGFEHPGSGERVEYEAPLPADMQELVELLAAEDA